MILKLIISNTDLLIILIVNGIVQRLERVDVVGAQVVSGCDHDLFGPRERIC